MRVDELSIQNFRNLADPVFRADPRINIIFGNNAQGKTNLMEALWLFTGNRSFRGAREAEMIAFGKQSARLQVITRELELLPSGGSDFHGANKPDVAIGRGRGGLRVSCSLLKDIKEDYYG